MNSESSSPAAPVLIAHRGEAGRYPENTLTALTAAVADGIRHLEFDVQLSADRVPVLSHDASLMRTAGIDRLVTAGLAAELTAISAGEPQRFGARFNDVCVASLSAVLDGLSNAPDLTLFVELKRHSLRAFGRQRVLSAVLPVLSATRHRVVLISFDAAVLAMAREQTDHAIGWVLSAYDDEVRDQTDELSPQFVFCNHTRLPAAGRPWPGPWHWAVYEVTGIVQARAFVRRGVTYLESMDAGALLREWRRLDPPA